MPTERGSSSIGAVVGSPLSADRAGKSARERENNGIFMQVQSHLNKHGEM